ncbi:MAG: hypothetical protein SVW57_08940 [Thermodesulfobacteriota bacterium]|nr:hypothetical protein [Thermodesulfobacteriota bacterium]
MTPVRVWRQRWRCPCCGRTFGPFDPDRVKRILDDLLAVQPKDLHISFYLDHIRTKLMGGTS